MLTTCRCAVPGRKRGRRPPSRTHIPAAAAADTGHRPRRGLLSRATRPSRRRTAAASGSGNRSGRRWEYGRRCRGETRRSPDHVGEQILPAALGQAQHGEVRIPVIDLAKSAAGHDVAAWERQCRGVTRGYRCFARQLIPQPVDVGGDGDLLGRRRYGGRLRREAAKCAAMNCFSASGELGRALVILTQDVVGRGIRNRVDECLAVRRRGPPTGPRRTGP